MTFERACRVCHVRSAIYRTSNPLARHWKNDFETLEERVPLEDQSKDDWEEYDPREHEECSAFNEMPA